ncbi:hypothetical protein Tco_1011985 [Tanacetum coccineum]
MRIDPIKTQKEATYQVILDTLALSPCYNPFLITADVPEIYMQQFWFTISKIKDSSSYKFKLDNKSYKVEIVSFIMEISYKGDVESVTGVVTDHMYQPWRTFAAIINRCLSGKITGLDKLRLSRAQILWGIMTMSWELCKSPTAELSEVDSGRISIRHCRMLKSITMNVSGKNTRNNA